MPDPDRQPRATRSHRPPDELVLAAVERGARHQARGARAVPVWVILDQLALSPRSAAARASAGSTEWLISSSMPPQSRSAAPA